MFLSIIGLQAATTSPTQPSWHALISRVSWFTNDMKRTTMCLILLLVLVPRADLAGPGSLIAQYHFDEGPGSLVRDSSGNKHDGLVMGGARWVPGRGRRAIVFDGSNRISIPSSTLLNVTGRVTVTAWIMGHGSGFRLVPQPASDLSLRAPYFQVCGDTLYFAANSDHPSGWWNSNEAHLFTGSIDINLDQWRDEQRTHVPFTGDEPKLQVVGDSIYYEYFGQDFGGAWQIWTAQSHIDGSDFTAVQRTHEKDGFRVEQGGIQVVENKIYYAWPQQDEKGTWQTWTATSRINGSGFEAAQRTTDGAAFVYQQVAGSKIFYLLNTSWGNRRDPAKMAYLNSMAIAVSDRTGGRLRVLRTIDGIPGGTGGMAFQVTKGKVYFAYIQADANDRVNLFTGSMNTDGSRFHARQRSFGKNTRGIPGVRQRGVTVVGDKVYYSLVLVDTDKGAKEASQTLFKKTTIGKDGVAFWTAEANIDGSGWKATLRTTSPPDIAPQYKSIAVTGGKIYYGAAEAREYREPYQPFRPYLGTSGSNIVNKGDAYGLGLTEWNQARAFINAGEDYLFRAEAPEDISGAVADWKVDESWHFVAMTYDQSNVKLYVDGRLKSSAPYREKPGDNPFPVMIGDGFIGMIDEVSIYNRPLSSSEILATYESTQTR